MNLKEKIQAINSRLSALETEVKTASAEKLISMETEMNELRSNREKLVVELREQVSAAFNSGSKVAQEKEEVSIVERMNKREKLAFALGKQARKVPLTEVEKRALGTALTATAATYVAATAELDGVNNAGVLIPTIILLDLLKEEGKISPIFRDVVFSNIPGLVEFPYRKSRDAAKVKAEGADGKQNQMEWETISGSKGVLQTIIAVTDEIRSLTDFDFGAYILTQIMQDLSEDWVSELIYGTGSNNRIKGITVGATAAVSGGYVAGKIIEAVVAGIKLCKGKFRRGAKIYISQDAYDEIAFATDDVGNFKYPILNNAIGISTFGPALKVEVDESLNEGEFIIGNISKYFKANLLKALTIETDRKPAAQVTEYVASVSCLTTPVPGAFIRGTKKA